MSVPPPFPTGDPEQDRRNQERYERDQEYQRRTNENLSLRDPNGPFTGGPFPPSTPQPVAPTGNPTPMQDKLDTLNQELADLYAMDQTDPDTIKAIADKTKEQQAAGAAAMTEGQQNLVSTAVKSPEQLATQTPVSTINPNTVGTTIAPGTGDAGATGGATPTITGTGQQAVTPDAMTPASVQATATQGAVDTALEGKVKAGLYRDDQGRIVNEEGQPVAVAQVIDGMPDPYANLPLLSEAKREGGVAAAQGTVSSTVGAATQDPTTMEGTKLDVAQITDPTKVVVPPARALQEGELIGGSAVDMAAVQEATDIQAAQANPSKQATVKGQLDDLMDDFEDDATPAWAAGAMRAATAAMAARGLGSSSMAGQAIVQAAMESALPIAQQDAQVVAQFEAQNLSNRQQVAMFAAQQRADFLKIDFNQEFQARVANATKISDIANMNFTADQQVALENAKMAQTANLTNLNAKNAKVMADAAAMSNMELANLSNTQQASVENAKNFLQMDLTNLSNEQQTEMFKVQALQQSILTDAAADNAAKQFNASSVNQTQEFMATLASQVSQFNTSQANAMEQFAVSETNAIRKFNEEQRNARVQFNTQNGLIIAQANAQWRQNTSTANTAAQNEANMQDAKAANAFTASTLDQVWQRERDLMSYAWKTSETSLDRINDIIVANISATASTQNAQTSADATDRRAEADMWGTIGSAILGYKF